MIKKGLHFFFLLFLGVPLTPAIIHAAFLNLPRDADGWTVFTPSADSRICYIAANGDDATGQYYAPADSAVGSDPFNPSGPIKAYATFTAAYANVRDGYPDWVLFKRGDTFTISYIDSINKSGRSLTAPFLLGAYGSAGSCPLIKTTSDTKGPLAISQGRHYIAVTGLDFYAQFRNPDDGGSVTSGPAGFRIYTSTGGLDGILIEGCKFRFYSIGATVECTLGVPVDVEFRRNTFADSYNIDGHSQGVYAHHITHLSLEENIFIHCGWLIPSTSGGKHRTGGQATVYNHSCYLSSVMNIYSKNNVSLIPSASHIKVTRKAMTESTFIDGELQVGGDDVCQAGNNYRDPAYDWHLPNFTIKNCVYTHGGLDDTLDLAGANGITIGGVDGGLIANNLIINYATTATNSKSFAAGYSKSRNVTWQKNIAYKASRKTMIRIGSPTAGSSGIVFKDNILQYPGVNISHGLAYADYDSRSSWSFSNNKYFAANQLFYTNGTTKNIAGWNTWSGDTGTWEQVSFPDATRDIETYMAHIGQTPTIDAFIAACRAQDRYNWDPNYEAGKVNAWIRAGFFPATSGTLSSPNNLRVMALQ